MQALGYPLQMNDRIQEITEARNIELGLGLQVKRSINFITHYVTFPLLTFSLPSALLLTSFKAQVRTPSVLLRAIRIRGAEDTGHSDGGAFADEAPGRTWQMAAREA